MTGRSGEPVNEEQAKRIASHEVGCFAWSVALLLLFYLLVSHYAASKVRDRCAARGMVAVQVVPSGVRCLRVEAEQP